MSMDPPNSGYRRVRTPRYDQQMRKLLIIIPMLAVLALTGCSVGATPVAKHTKTPAPAAAHSVQQWASKVAEQKASFDEWATPWASDSCSASSVTEMPCSAEIVTGTFTVETISLNLQGVSKDFGTPPSEIRDLVSETNKAADDANSAAQSWSNTCSAAEGSSCVQLALTFTSAMDALSEKFTAWSPYL